MEVIKSGSKTKENLLEYIELQKKSIKSLTEENKKMASKLKELNNKIGSQRRIIRKLKREDNNEKIFRHI